MQVVNTIVHIVVAIVSLIVLIPVGALLKGIEKGRILSGKSSSL